MKMVSEKEKRKVNGGKYVINGDHSQMGDIPESQRYEDRVDVKYEKTGGFPGPCGSLEDQNGDGDSDISVGITTPLGTGYATFDQDGDGNSSN